jgi:hypothetical protein
MERWTDRAFDEHMKYQRIAWNGLLALGVAGLLAAGIYYIATRDPTPVKVDARMPIRLDL